MNVSKDLVWLCTRNRSSFLVKRDGAEFTSEPGNPTNSNSAKFSGLGNSRTADVRAAGDSYVITMKKVKDQNKPNKATRSIKVKAADHKRVAKTVKALLATSYYRPELATVVAGRVSKLAQAKVRLNKMNEGKLKIRYGRKAAPFPFNKAAASQEDLPPLGAADEMD